MGCRRHTTTERVAQDGNEGVHEVQGSQDVSGLLRQRTRRGEQLLVLSGDRQVRAICNGTGREFIVEDD